MSERAQIIIYRILLGIALYFMMSFILSLKWHIVAQYIPKLLEAIWLTIQLTFLSLFFGFIIALPLGLLRAKNRPKCSLFPPMPMWPSFAARRSISS